MIDMLNAWFDSTSRLYRLQGAGALADLHVQAWSLREQLSEPFTLQVMALSTQVDLDLDAMLGQRLDLVSVLAGGGEQLRSGVVTAAQAEEGDGGFVRYTLEVRPWIALLAHTRRSQVWQERSLRQIVDSVFSEGVNEPSAPALGPESSPIEAQSTDGSIDPSSICNEEWARFRAQPEGPGYPRALGRVAPLAQVA